MTTNEVGLRFGSDTARIAPSLLIQRSRRRLGAGVELGAQDIGAEAVLAQRLGALALPHIAAHR